jgi:CHAT domain-containing protein
LTGVLAGNPDVALIPVGAVSLLPVHAALQVALAAHGVAVPTIRYLPNARSIAHTPHPWRLSGEVRVLAIDAGDGSGRPPLRYARREVDALAVRYRGRTYPLHDATVAAALAALPGAGLVHFSCHGRADLGNPLAGGLLLTDGWLTVQTMLARPPSRRQLVVLGACQSHLAGDVLPDEVLGMPAALLQAGAAGVVATLWQVDERATALTLRRFHDLLIQGVPAARALTLAQQWLRVTRQGEFQTRYPDVFADVPAPATDGMRTLRESQVPYADPVHWAAFSFTGQ